MAASTCVQAGDVGSNGQAETIGPITLAPGAYFYFHVDSSYDVDQIGSSGPYTLSPCRLLDTRDPPGPWGGPALVAGAQRTFEVVGRCSIPVGARAIAVNIAVTQSTAPGNAGQ